MKTASIWLTIDKTGSNVFKTGLTAPEVQILNIKHSAAAGRMAVTDLKEDGDIKRSDVEELKRLCDRYGRDFVHGLFGKVNPRFPADFKAALLTAEPEEGATEEEVKPVLTTKK